jgi:hypothetical protein
MNNSSGSTTILLLESTISSHGSQALPENATQRDTDTEKERERWTASKLASSWKRPISFYCKHIELAAAELQTMSLLLLAATLSLLDTHKKTQLHKETPLVISDESS